MHRRWNMIRIWRMSMSQNSGIGVDLGWCGKPLALTDGVTGSKMWRVTHNPHVSHIHRYFNVPAFSPDGRWLAIIRGQGDGWRSEAFELHDLETHHVIELKDAYGSPTWNTVRNEFYWLRDRQLCAFDCDTRRQRVLYEWSDPGDMFVPWSVDRTGCWLLGSNTLVLDPKARACIRKLSLDRNDRPIDLYRAPEIGCSFFLVRANPAHDIAAFRYHTPCGHAQPDGNHFAMIDLSTGVYFPAEYPEEWGHRSWSGDGQWYVRANMERFVVKPWDHCHAEDPWLYCSAFYSTNHMGPCGNSGRFMIGDYSDDMLHLLDTVTGRTYDIAAAPSFAVPYSKHADPHPIGSPDGTKVVFDCCYDLEHAPVARLSSGIDPNDMIVEVDSTRGFPEQGKILVGDYAGEFMTYDRCDEHRFFIAQRSIAPERSGDSGESQYVAPRSEPGCFAHKELVTSFAGRHLHDGRVREADVFVVRVQKPQIPRSVQATRTADGVNVSWLAPPNHREIKSYRIWQRGADPGSVHCIGESNTLNFLDQTASGQQCAYSVSSREHFPMESDRSTEVVVAADADDSYPGMSWLIPAAEGRLPLMGCWDELEQDAYNSRVLCGDNGGKAPFLLNTPVSAKLHVWVRSKSRAESHAIAVTCGQTAEHEILIKGGPWHWTRISPPEAITMSGGSNELCISYRSKYCNELKIDLLCVAPDGAEPMLPTSQRE